MVVIVVIVVVIVVVHVVVDVSRRALETFSEIGEAGSGGPVGSGVSSSCKSKSESVFHVFNFVC